MRAHHALLQLRLGPAGALALSPLAALPWQDCLRSERVRFSFPIMQTRALTRTWPGSSHKQLIRQAVDLFPGKVGVPEP